MELLSFIESCQARAVILSARPYASLSLSRMIHSYVGLAMEQLGTAFLAGIQKSNGLDIHKRHSVKVHRNPRLITVHLGLQFIEMLRSQSTAQANDFLLPIGICFNLQCHLRLLRRGRQKELQ